MMMTRMDAIEAGQRRGITHVIRDDNEEEEELETMREEQEERMKMEERITKFTVLEVNLNWAFQLIQTV